MKRIFTLLSLTTTPVLFWSAPNALTLKPPLQSLFFLVLGLLVFGLGHSLIFCSNSGVSPWMVLADGLALQFKMSLASSIILISCVVLFFWIPLRQKPGLGTFLNFIVVAIVIETTTDWLPIQVEFLPKITQAFLGIAVSGFGAGIYLIANLGPGARDGLMTGISDVTQFPMAYVRNILELSIILIGWLLGGSAGLGTLLFAILIGPFTVISMQFLATTTKNIKPQKE